MDIDLGPGKMDGIQAAEIILQQRDLPIVFCTSHAEKEIVERVKGITRYGYVIKNSGEFVMLETVNTAFDLFEACQNLKKKTGTAVALKNSYRNSRRSSRAFTTILP